jgi:hypothetical protein
MPEHTSTHKPVNATSTPRRAQARPGTAHPEQERQPDIPAQVERAARFGHSLSNVPVQPQTSNTGSNGRQLPEGVLRKMGRAFGADFSGVRVHEGKQADSLGALAYTQGEHIHFAPGLYRPASADGQLMIGHELTHVVQQMQGLVKPTLQANGVAINDDQRLEAEADVEGARAMRTKISENLHAPSCSCPSCLRGQKKESAGENTSHELKGQTLPPGPSSPHGVIQMICGKCGSNKHSTNSCPQTKQQSEAHKEKVKVFHEKKHETVEAMKQEQKKDEQKSSLEKKKSEKKSAVTPAFAAKHVVPAGIPPQKAAEDVAQKRTWGGGGESGRSTVVKMTPEEQQQEARIQVQGLKMSEADVKETGIEAKQGVNKPTSRAYPSVTSVVTTDPQGKRTVTHQKEELAQPVLGMKGEKFHHLHGVKKEDE